MNRKIIQKLSRVSLVIMLLLAMATMVNPGSGWVPPSAGTWVYIEPQDNIYDTNNATVGDNFTISVYVSNVTNLYGYEIHLLYDTEQLDASNPYLPDGHFLTPVDPTKIFIAKLETDDAYNATHGRVLIAVLLLSPEPAKNGSGLLFNVDFTIRMKPERWETLSSVIDLGLPEPPFGDPSNKLGDPDALAIPHDSKNGLFQYSWALPTTKAKFVVDPNVYHASEVGEEFSVNINVENVDPDWEVMGAEFTLEYNATLLGVVGVVNGAFMLGPYGNNTIWTWVDTSTPGVMVYSVIGLGGLFDYYPPEVTSGTLATITFVTGVVEPLKLFGCALDLQDTKLGTIEGLPIPTVEPNDGWFDIFVPHKAELYEWKLKVNYAAGIGKGHKSTVGEENLLEAYVINTGFIDVNVQVLFKVTDSAFAPVATVMSDVALLSPGQTTILSATWTASEADVYLITAYLFYGPISPTIEDDFSRTQTLRVHAT